MSAAPDPQWIVSLVDPARSAPVAEQVPGGGGYTGSVVVTAPDDHEAAHGAVRVAGTAQHMHALVAGPFRPGSWAPQWCDRLLTQQETEDLPEPAWDPATVGTRKVFL